MKIIRSFCLVGLCLSAATFLQAQHLTTKTAEPVKSTIPPPGTRPATVPDSKPLTKGGELKPADTKNPASLAVNEDDMKPKTVPAKNVVSASPSTLAVDMPNTVRPTPLMPNMSSTITTTAPVIKEAKKPAPLIAEQQKQN